MPHCYTSRSNLHQFLSEFDKHRDKKEEEEKKTKTMKINLSITITKWLTVTLSSQTFLNLS